MATKKTAKAAPKKAAATKAAKPALKKGGIKPLIAKS